MNFDYGGMLFQVLFWLVAMTFMMRWFSRSRLRERPASQARELRQPPAILIVALICLAMSVAMLIGAFSASGGVIPFAVGSAMTLLSLFLIADYYRARHVVDDQGMDYGRALGKRSMLRWDEVRRIDFNKRMNWYALALESGVNVRVSGTHMGLPEFATHVLRHVPAERVAPRVQQMLEDAAQGRLHRIWP